MTLNIPQTRDPIARVALLAMVGLVAYIAVTTPGPVRVGAADTERQPVIMIATPTLPAGPAFAPIAEQGSQDTPAVEVATPELQSAPVAELAAPTIDVNWIQPPPPPAEPQDLYAAGGDQAQAAPEGEVNPYAGMETVNGHLFVPTPNPYAGMETVNQAYLDAEAYKYLPSKQFDNAPYEPSQLTQEQLERQLEWSSKRTR